MTKNRFLGVLAFGGLAAIISCDSGSSGTSSGLASNDCPIGTFRPVGIQDCVFPAADVNGQQLGVSDNRCATGQPAVPPQCVSDTGQRAYFSTSTTCAPGYRFLDGACNRNTFPTGAAGDFGTGSAGFFGTGAAGTSGLAGTDGTAGSTGTAGIDGTAGSTSGAAGIDGTAGFEGILGQAGTTGSSTGGAGTGAGGAGGVSASDASSDGSSS